MQRTIIAAVFCVLAVNVTSQPNQSPTQRETYPKPESPTSLALENNNVTTYYPEQAKSKPPKWYAALERPDWWLVLIAGLTGLAIAYQAKEMSRATKEMQASTEIAKQSAEAAISKERARIKVGVSKINPQSQQFGVNVTTCWLENYGPTPAFVDEFRAQFLHVPQKDIASDYAQCKLVLYSETIQPNTRTTNGFLIVLEPNLGSLSEEDVSSIRKGESFLHFYGFVKYRDIFDRNRRTTIHMRWTMRWGGMVQGQIMDWWDPVGLPEENRDA